MQKANSFVQLSHLGLLSIQGVDAKTFLQGQVTCNLDDITPAQSRLTAHCNLKGRMQSLFRLSAIEQTDGLLQYFLTLPISMVAPVQQSLKKYALFSKVQIEDYSHKWAKIGLCGESITQHLPESLARICVAHAPDDCLHSEGLNICRIPGLQSRYEIMGQSDVIDSLASKLSAHCVLASTMDWELWDIEAGLPTVYPSTADQFLPHHVNLVQLKGISFSKGCYLGQEVVARMHYRGKIKKHMYHVSAPQQSGAMPGDPIFVKEASSSEAPGTVVRVAQSATRDHLLVILDEQYANFDNISLHALEGLKLSRLELPYPI